MNDSGFGRLFGVLFSPAKTFRAIAERPTWAWPLLVVTLATAGMYFLMYQRVDMAAYIQQQQQKSQGGQQLPADQVEAQEKIFEAMNRYMPAALGGFFLLFMPLILLFITLLYWGGLRLAGSEVTYGQSFATVVHGSMPAVISALLSVPVILGRSEISMEETQRGGGVLASNLGALAPEGTGPVLLAFLSGIDFFVLWGAVLLILGFEIVARVKRSTATWVVLVVFLITIGFRVGSVALGATMGR